MDTPSGLVHTAAGTAANVNDLIMAGALLHGEEEVAFGDAGYQGVHKRPEARGPTWHVAMRRGLRRKLYPYIEPDFVAERTEKMKASIRSAWSSSRSASPRCGTEDWPGTRRNLPRCSHCPTCGWRVDRPWGLGDECAHSGHRGRERLTSNRTSHRVAQTFLNCGFALPYTQAMPDVSPLFQALYDGIATCLNLDTQALAPDENGVVGFQLKQEEVALQVIQTPAGTDLLLIADLGAAPEGDGAAVADALLDANYLLLEPGGPVFGRNPLTQSYTVQCARSLEGLGADELLAAGQRLAMLVALWQRGGLQLERLREGAPVGTDLA